MRVLIVVGLLQCSLLAAGDWPTYRGDVRRTGYTEDGWEGAAAETVWTFRSPQRPQPAWPGPARWDSWANVRGLGAMRNYDPCFHVVAAGERLFFGSSADDSVHCLDAKSGGHLWTFTTDGPVRIAPTIAAGNVYFGSDDGHAYCVRADDGTLIWKSPPANDAEQILNNGRFVSLAPCRTGVLVDGDLAYFGLGLLPWQDAVLMAVDARTGRPDGPGCFVERQVGLTMEGALLAKKSHLVAPGGRVPPYVFDKFAGTYQGQLEGSGGSSVVVTDQGHVLCGPGNKTGWICETNIDTRKQLASYVGPVAAAVTPTHRIFVSRTRLSAVDAVNGQTAWDVACPHHLEVIVAGQTVITGGDDAVAAFSLDDGRLLWETAVEGRAFGLAVTEGWLFVSTDAGVIHCLRPCDEAPAITAEPETSNLAAASGAERPEPSVPTSPQQRAEEKRGLVGHWLVHREMSALARRRGLPEAEQRLSDLTGRTHALIRGPVSLREVGGVEALELDGETNSIVISNDLEKVAPPREALTAEVWVRIDEANSEGGIIGCFEKTKQSYQGWLLGCHQSRFVFTFAAEGGAEGPTRLKSQTTIRPGHWYHVAATYDGETATLLINGEEEDRSDAQTGPIDAPTSGFYEMGVYHDRRLAPSALWDVARSRVYEHAVAAADITRRYREKHDRFAVPIELEIGPAWLSS
ncbi:MAG: PQQ-binding-like beta-propeller repeat protein [Planctomycetaceae bacterium]|nr:PQQ-binding-like beta-propeller repeat protein [Planctomycetaceae bacterium]